MENNLTPYQEEIWKDIEGYNGDYQISNLGRVKSVERKIYRPLIGECVLKERLLSPTNSQGYKKVVLYKDGVTANNSIHRLIAIHFIPNPNNYPCINHINSDRSDNRIENLEWCTYSHNNKHAYTSGYNYSNLSQLGRTGEKSKLSKPVFQFDINFKFIKEWCGASEASRQTGVDVKLISLNCLKKTKISKGFIWRYKSDLTPYEMFQIERYKNVLPEIGQTKDEDLFESGLEELNRLAEWTESLAEMETLDKQ